MNETTTNPPLHMWEAEVDTVIAASAEEACAIFINGYGDPGDDGGKPEDWTLVPDDKAVKYWRDGRESGGEPESKAAIEFVREFGKGYFGSSEF